MQVWSDDVSKWSLLQQQTPAQGSSGGSGASTDPLKTVRGALRAAGIETRREESMRNRWTSNTMRARHHPTGP